MARLQSRAPTADVTAPRCSRTRLIRSSTFAGDSRPIRSAGPECGAGSLAPSSRRRLISFASRLDLLTPSSMRSGCDNPEYPASLFETGVTTPTLPFLERLSPARSAGR